MSSAMDLFWMRSTGYCDCDNDSDDADGTMWGPGEDSPGVPPVPVTTEDGTDRGDRTICLRDDSDNGDEGPPFFDIGDDGRDGDADAETEVEDAAEEERRVEALKCCLCCEPGRW